jgi:uncharacterized membrane protein YraQ (UPF0718 family)
MTAAPIINPAAVLSTWYAYGGNVRMVAARVGFGIVCALLAGFFFSFRSSCYHFNEQENHVECSCCSCSREPSATRFSYKLFEVLEHSREEFIEVGTWQITGIAVATVFQVWIKHTAAFSSLNSFHGIPGKMIPILGMMGLAFFLSLCSSSDAVICRVIGKGLSPAPQLAFLVFGPMMDIKNIIMLSGMCSPKFAVRMAVTTFCICFLVMLGLSFSGLESFLL